ncbi:MAG: aldehyde dehydrogenase family protein [Acidimicrobiales bacterium]
MPNDPAGTPLDTAALDAAVSDVAARVTSWAATTPAARASLLDRVLRDTVAAADGWLADACRAKGLAPDSPEAAEELFAGIVTFVRMARLFRDSIRDIGRSGRPRYPGPVTVAPEGIDGQLRVGVFPASKYDRLLFAQTTGEVWMQPGVSRTDVDAGQARAYRDPAAVKGISLVLGAGNVACLGPRDALSKLFVEGRVVVLKANPVNDYLVPHWERAMRALVDAGVLRIVRGGAEAGAYLTNHPKVDDVHITGSDKTHDAVVFGPGEDGARRKAADERLLDKPVTCELGNVSPVVIVPGVWSAADLLYQAEHVATMLVNNAGFNCLTARVIITHAGWPQREAFFGALSQALTRIPTRLAYYPGAGARRDAFVAAHPDVVSIGASGDGALPWTLVRGVDPGKVDDIAFNVEAFCGLTAETALPAASTAAFIDAAVDFCNSVVWGTLSATVLVHPDTERDPDVAAAMRRAVAGLRYGGIGVNIWHATVFALGTTTWGAFPGHRATDIQSGTGVVGNAYMFDRPEKSVVRGPFRSRPKPPWFATQRHPLPVMRRLLAFEADPSPLRLAAVMSAALRS